MELVVLAGYMKIVTPILLDAYSNRITEGVDAGPIIRQATVPVYQDDTEESLSARILLEEHRLYPEAIQLYAENRLLVEGRRVRIR